MDPAPLPTPTARRFRFVECLGRGGFGEVYRAAMTDRGGVRTDVAVKVLHDEVKETSQAVRRLRDEAHALAALRHPAILRVLDLVTLEGRVALVTEYVEGEDLTSLIRGDGRIPPRPLVDVVGQIASALAAAHDTPGEGGAPLGLVHRDVKPHNIRVGRHGEVKLLDFGIARGDGLERTAQTTDDVIVGSLQYMAPEAFDEVAGPASDVFSLGCVLLEGLAQIRPWSGIEARKLYALVHKPADVERTIVAQLARLPPDTAPALRTLCADLLAPTAAERPTAHEVAARCEELVEQLDGPTLRRWCAGRAWATGGTHRGEYDGREVVEGQVSGRPLVSPTEASARPRRDSDTLDRSSGLTSRRTVAMAASGVVGVTLGAAALLGVLAVAVLVAWWTARAPQGLEPTATTVPVAPPPPAPAEVPLPAEPAAVASPAPAEAEAPAEPEVPAGSAKARVHVDERTRVPVRLVSGDVVAPLPAEVGPGTWTIEADFGAGWVAGPKLPLQAGDDRTVWCKQLTRICEVVGAR
jgi:serine/threonine protein kinase